jgi:hypothetical protein
MEVVSIFNRFTGIPPKSFFLYHKQEWGSSQENLLKFWASIENLISSTGQL